MIHFDKKKKIHFKNCLEKKAVTRKEEGDWIEAPTFFRDSEEKIPNILINENGDQYTVGYESLQWEYICGGWKPTKETNVKEGDWYILLKNKKSYPLKCSLKEGRFKEDSSGETFLIEEVSYLKQA